MDPGKRLKLFLRGIEDLRNTRALQKGLRTHTAFRYSKVMGAVVESETPDKEELRSFLVIWRKFFLKKEAINLDVILAG